MARAVAGVVRRDHRVDDADHDPAARSQRDMGGPQHCGDVGHVMQGQPGDDQVELPAGKWTSSIRACSIRPLGPSTFWAAATIAADESTPR